MSKKAALNRKAYTYGGKKKDDKDGWNKISESKASEKGRLVPKNKGIWSNVTSVSPFKKSPLKLSIDTRMDDPFDFNDSDNDCFTFKEDGVKVTPSKIKRTPSKQFSPRSPSGVNPRLFGKTLPSESKTINVSDLTPDKKSSKTGKGKQLKKGTLAALKAELSSPQKLPTKSPKKGSLAELKEKLSSPKKKTSTSPVKSPKKGSLAALKEKLSSPKKKGQTVAAKKSPVKKSPQKVVSKKVKKSPPKNKKEAAKSPVKNENRKRKVINQKDEPPTKRKVGRPSKNEETNKSVQSAVKKTAPVKKTQQSSATKVLLSAASMKKAPVSSLRQTGRMTRAVAAVSPPKRTTSRSRQNDADPHTVIAAATKRKAGRPRNTEKKTEKNLEPPTKRKAEETAVDEDSLLATSEGDELVSENSQEGLLEDSPEDTLEESQGEALENSSEEVLEDTPDSIPEDNQEEKDILEESQGVALENNSEGILADIPDDTPGDSQEEDDILEESQEGDDILEESHEETPESSNSNDVGEILPENADDEKTKQNNIDNDNVSESMEVDDINNEKDGDEIEEDHFVHKTKSVFSYYDKQKKNPNENIYGDSKKNVIIFDDGVDDDKEGGKVAAVVRKREVEKNRNDDVTTTNVIKDSMTDRTQSPTPDQNDATKQAEREKKLVKSPFKSLKPQYRKYRRFSALPTDITMLGNTTTQQTEGEEINDEEDVEEQSSFHMSNIFGQSASSSFKVRRDEKELYTVVRDTKHAYQCLEHGESQQFKDDLEYLIDGVKSTNNNITRCLSALELASKCMSPEFRMHMKAHGMIDTIFHVLQDAHTDELLCLCTSAIMYVVSKDRQKTGFSKKIIAFVLNLLTNAPMKQNTQKSSEKIHNKIRSLFEKYNDSAIDCGNINSSMLARETLLSLTSQKTGEWFKDDIRTLGGLDHIADTIYASSRYIQKREDVEKHFKQTERCLLLLCDITFKCAKNQDYLVTYRDGSLVEGLVRTLSFITTKVDLTNDFSVAIQNCLFTILRFLTNLSHENEMGSVRICKRDDALQCFLRCVLYMPQFLPENKTFDFIVVALGLLINLTEHSKQNIEILNTAFGPACYESEASSSIDDEVSPVEALTHLFLVRNEASKEGDLMEELERLEKEQDEKEAAMHYHDGEDALVCGDKFDDTVEETTQNDDETKTKEGETNNDDSLQLNQKEKQDIKNTLQKAHQHMEDSHVAAYSALLIGLLAERNKDNQDTIHSLLPDGDFQPMKESLEKILAFMKMTGATNEAGFTVIQRIIDFFQTCTQTHKKKSGST